MRLFLVLALGVAFAGSAQAQIKPIAPIPQPKSFEPKPTPGFQPFKPYEPPKPIQPMGHVDTNSAPSGLYPELHKKPKKHDGF